MEKVEELKLDQLSQEQSNKAYTFKELGQYYNNQFAMSKTGTYYPYNYFTKDVGMGCAWRAIQTLLSTSNIDQTFRTLYEKFSKKEVIVKILREKQSYQQEVLQILTESVWAPAQIQAHWAQPFIGSIACKANNLSHKLFVINGHPFSYAPAAVFQQVLSFQQFYALAKTVISHSSIMIDDGKYALSIIGINLNLEDKIEFLFGDPHIRCNKSDKSVGVYRKTFDLNGKSIENQMTEIQRDQSLYKVYEALEFETKKWMVCLILS